MQNELLTAEEVADRLRIKADTVILWARQGKIPAHRLSRKVIRFRLAEVIAALEDKPSTSDYLPDAPLASETPAGCAM